MHHWAWLSIAAALSGCSVIESNLHSARMWGAAPLPTVHVPRQNDSDWIQTDLGIHGMLPYRNRSGMRDEYLIDPNRLAPEDLVLSGPLEQEFDPVSAVGEVSFFSSNNKKRYHFGLQFVHEIKSVWTGIGWKLDVPASTREFEFDLMAGKTKIAQASTWSSVVTSGVIRKWTERYDNLSVESNRFEWLWRASLSTGPKASGFWGAMETGSTPVVRGPGKAAGNLWLATCGAGWFWSTSIGRIGLTAHATQLAHRTFASMQTKWIRDIGSLNRYRPNDERRPKSVAWPEGREALDTVITKPKRPPLPPWPESPESIDSAMPTL